MDRQTDGRPKLSSIWSIAYHYLQSYDLPLLSAWGPCFQRMTSPLIYLCYLMKQIPLSPVAMRTSLVTQCRLAFVTCVSVQATDANTAQVIKVVPTPKDIMPLIAYCVWHRHKSSLSLTNTEAPTFNGSKGLALISVILTDTQETTFSWSTQSQTICGLLRW